jgi:dUTP pyrophosphatase
MTLGQDPQTVGDIPHDHITLSEEPADAGITTGYNMVSVQVKILDDAFIAQYGLPTYETLMAAGFDLRANIPEPVTLRPGQQITVGTGLALYIGDPNYAMYALPRSGLGTKGLVLGNLVGFIDPDYQGELKLTLLNRNRITRTDLISCEDEHQRLSITINPGDRVAQGYIGPVTHACFRWWMSSLSAPRVVTTALDTVA